MVKSSFECETVTPLFMYGADQNKPEIRAASIKGVMRWWWRAIIALDDINDLRNKEADIFGSMDKKSSFTINVNVKKLNQVKYDLLPHKGRAPLPSINSEYKFEITITSNSDIDYVHNIFELTCLLGGFGKRSRRGFGSIKLKDWNFDNKKDILNKTQQLLNYFKNDFKIDNNFSIIKKDINKKLAYPFIKKISVGKEVSNYDDLLKNIGNLSHNFSNPSLGSGNPRMASPVYVSIIKISDKFAPIVTELNSAFPPKYPKYFMQKQTDFINGVLK